MNIIETKIIPQLLDWKTEKECKAVLTVGGLGVATGDYKGDFSAYFDDIEKSVDEVARTGVKMSSAQAMEHFPEYIKDETYYRR